jgi:signal transduction histidine kinase
MRSLSRQLTLGLVAACSLLILAGGGLMYAAIRSALYRQFDEGLRTKVLAVVTATETRRGRVTVDFSDRYLREFDRRVAEAFFQVWHGASVVSRSDSLQDSDLPGKFGSIERPVTWDMELPDNRAGRAIGVELRPRGGDDPVIAVVAATRGSLEAMLGRFALMIIGGGGGLLLVVALVIPRIVGPGLNPLRKVAEQASTIGARTLEQRFPVEGMPTEIVPICERLNALLARLESSFARERRFSADLAHEIMTPLAEMRVLTESALKWPETSGPEMHRQSLGSLLRMQELVTRLLDLSRAENDEVEVHPVDVDAGAILRDLWPAYADRAAARRLEVNWDLQPDTGFRCDEAFLRTILRNLLSNAVEHSPPGVLIRISVLRRGDRVQAEISNPAPGFTQEDAAQCFDRFWKKDRSRSGTHGGLGLSLARELAAAIGATLEARVDEAGVLTMTLDAPVEPPAVS